MFKSFAGAAALATIAAASAVPAQAQNYPLESGGLMEVTGIHVEDGGAYSYATWLADEWRKQEEFAKSKGWITNYQIYSNLYAREGEPDLYLVVWFPKLADAAESKKREAEYRDYMKKSDAQMDKESGNRTAFRKVGGSMLLEELNFTK